MPVSTRPPSRWPVPLLVNNRCAYATLQHTHCVPRHWCPLRDSVSALVLLILGLGCCQSVFAVAPSSYHPPALAFPGIVEWSVQRIKSIMLPAPSTKSTNPAGTSAGTTEEWMLHAKGLRLFYPASVGLAPGPCHKLDAPQNHGEDAVVSRLPKKVTQWRVATMTPHG
ncbi:hypothetical protein B0H13DRAFT_1905904 [Mycena leptocephala]|nr:hypothetical protein B0H13DRAFT_1905904 [Mycena leptocephala]